MFPLRFKLIPQIYRFIIGIKPRFDYQFFHLGKCDHNMALILRRVKYFDLIMTV